MDYPCQLSTPTNTDAVLFNNTSHNLVAGRIFDSSRSVTNALYGPTPYAVYVSNGKMSACNFSGLITAV